MYNSFDPATTRDIYLTGEICEETIIDTIQKIDAINDWYREEVAFIMEQIAKCSIVASSDVQIVPPEDRINLHITSHGGDGDAMMALHQTMRLSDVHIDTIAEGYVQSCGLLIFMCGSDRYTFSDTQHLWHHMSTGMRGHIEKLNRIIESDNKFQQLMDDLTIEKTCGLVTQEKIDSLRERCMDWGMYGEEAIENGFADYLMDGDADSLQKIFIKNEEVSLNRDYVDTNGNEFKVEG